MKKINAFIMVTAFLLWASANNVLTANTHTFHNETDGTIQVTLYTVFGGNKVRDLPPKTETVVDVGGWCITNIYCIGTSGPVDGLTKWFPPEGNKCGSHNYTITANGTKRYLSGTSGTSGAASTGGGEGGYLGIRQNF
jgi:hypothetical protein